MSAAVDWASKALLLLVVVLACLFVAWQCIEGVMRITEIGREILYFIRNRSAFERWKREVEK